MCGVFEIIILVEERPPFVPQGGKVGGMDVEKVTEKDIEEENGGHGVYNIDLRKFWS